MSVTIEREQSELRNQQLIELEMVAEIDRICRKNNIKYSLDGGTLLGAIRHKGFIPWDDDADVMFTREEYNKFAEACKTDLDTERFFFQDYKTDPYYRWGYGKMRANNTEFVRSGQEKMKYKTGVFVDIFPMDNVPDNPVLTRLNCFMCYCVRKALYSEVGKEKAPNAFLRLWYKLLYNIPKDTLFAILMHYADKNNRKRTKKIRLLTFPALMKEAKYGVPQELFDEYTDVEFEGMKFRAVKDYHTYLTLLYRDYMKLPPIEKQKAPHPSSSIRLFPITLEEIHRKYGCIADEKNEE